MRISVERETCSFVLSLKKIWLFIIKMCINHNNSFSSRVFSWFLLLLLIIMNIIVCDGKNSSNIIQNILPTYAIAKNAENILPKSSKCRQELEIFREAVDNQRVWSLRMLDSSGQPGSGFTYGNNYWTGSKHQCYDILNSQPLAVHPRYLVNNQLQELGEELPPYKLDYFTAHISHNSTFQYRLGRHGENLITLGLCLPAACTTEELSKILRKILDEEILIMNRIYSMELQLLNVKYSKDDNKYFSDWHMITLLIFVIITVSATISATWIDVCVKKKQRLPVEENVNNGRITVNSSSKSQFATESPKKLLNQVLMCFSAYTNSKDIFENIQVGDSIESLYGIRVLGITWMILCHILLFGIDHIDNQVWSMRLAMTLPGPIIANGSLAVDTFFFMGGFLLAHSFLRSNKERERISSSRDVEWKSFFQRIFKRFIRLTPAYMIIIGAAEIIFLHYERTSHIYMITDRSHETCPKFWWRNFFYINNFFKRSEMCIYWSYYLSNDMQFFIVGSFLLFLSSKYYHTALILFFGVFLVSTIVAGYKFYTFNYVPTIGELLSTMDIFYDPPWMRIGPYFIGLATAYILIQMNGTLHVKRSTLWLLWIFGISCNLIALFGIANTSKISILSTVIYMTLHRTIWAIGIGWLVVACLTNNAGVINTILSFKLWQPLSKLTYCANLLNPLIIKLILLNNESSFHVDIVAIAVLFIGVWVLSYLSAFILAVMFEVPYMSLMKLYFANKPIKIKAH